MQKVGFPLRLAAALIDALIAYFAGVAILFASYAAGVPQNVYDLMFWSWVLLYSFTEVPWTATPGKRILGISIRDFDGTGICRWRRFSRWMAKWSPIIFSLLLDVTGWLPFNLLGGFLSAVILVGCVAILNDDKRAWHDEWAGTAVFRKRKLKAAL